MTTEAHVRYLNERVRELQGDLLAERAANAKLRAAVARQQQKRHQPVRLAELLPSIAAPRGSMRS
jgi:hypothetical protein